MAYDERLAKRIRGYFKRRKGVEEKRMFGGLCFMLNSHMCCGVEKDRLMARRGGFGNSDSVLSGSLASPKPPSGGEHKEQGDEANTTESRSDL
ncbi:MAG: TfoX/Sxy family protein [Nitrospira sp.]|nr:TfoX/Sxy family protein [Nitrospira sp.]